MRSQGWTIASFLIVVAFASAAKSQQRDVGLDHTGQTETVAGVECEIVQIVRDGRPGETLCLASADALGVDDDTFAVFHGNPLTKYEAYRQILERWRDDVPAEEEVDLTPAVHHLLSVLLDFLEVRPSRYRLHHR